MEPSFLDRLPPRFRKRWRGNVIALAVIVSLFIIPPRCGDYGIAAFFTIVWLANSGFYLMKLLEAQPRAGWPAFALLAAMTLLFGYPVVIGWAARTFDGAGLIAILVGWIALLGFVIAYRRIVFPSIFGANRQSWMSEFRAVRAAQAAARTEARANFKRLIDRN